MKNKRAILADMSAPYSALESWAYDRVIAPAVLEMGERIAEELARNIDESATVLDVGCGGGQIAVEIAERRPRARVKGVDLSPEQVSRAQKRARSAGVDDRVEFVQGSALDLPFGCEFDVVTSVASIKHWPDQARGLSECVRVLRPGGQLFVFEADRGCHLEDAAKFVRHWRLPRALHLLALGMFRTWVAGQALDLDDARALLAPLGLEDAGARRVAGTPALAMTGRKARDAAS